MEPSESTQARSLFKLIDSQLIPALQHAYIKYVLHRPFDSEISVERQMEQALKAALGDQLFFEWLASEADDDFMRAYMMRTD